MNILLVDDDHMSRLQFSEIASKLDFVDNIVEFDSPYDAKQFAAGNRVDLAVLDIEMDEVNGIELARQLREFDSELNIIFITAYSQYALEAYMVDGMAYILKPYLDNEVTKALGKAFRINSLKSKSRIRIQTFGGFDVFVDGMPLHFPRSKSKEILALLVDRRGSSMTSASIISVLWEEYEDEQKAKDQFKKAFQVLKSTLKTVGASDILIDSFNDKSVDITQFSCDFYESVDSPEVLRGTFNCDYMPEYSWAEERNALLYRLST